MLRLSLLGPTLLFTSAALAADLPKDITPEAKAAIIKKCKSLRDDDREKWTKEAEDAQTLIKFAGTAAEGKKKLAQAKSILAGIEKFPQSYANRLAVEFVEPPLAAGSIGRLRADRNEFAVIETSDDGVAVECVLSDGGNSTGKKILRYFIASPLKVPKGKGKKDPIVSLPGLWYVAGTTEVKGKTVPVLYRFELTKEDFEEKPEK
jgi:hypothetical protein